MYVVLNIEDFFKWIHVCEVSFKSYFLSNTLHCSSCVVVCRGEHTYSSCLHDLHDLMFQFFFCEGEPGLPGLPTGLFSTSVGSKEIGPININENYPAGYLMGPPGPEGPRGPRGKRVSSDRVILYVYLVPYLPFVAVTRALRKLYSILNIF